MLELEKNYIDPSMIIEKAYKLIDSAEETAQQSLFGKQEKDFILNYAYKSQDLKRTEKLVEIEKAQFIGEAKRTITNMEKLLKDNPELKNDSKFMQIGKRMYDLVQKEGFDKFYGRIDRLDTDGKIGETLLFDNEEKYRYMINDRSECGDPITYKKISEKEYNELSQEQEGKERKEKDLER